MSTTLDLINPFDAAEKFLNGDEFDSGSAEINERIRPMLKKLIPSVNPIVVLNRFICGLEVRTGKTLEKTELPLDSEDSASGIRSTNLAVKKIFEYCATNSEGTDVLMGSKRIPRLVVNEEAEKLKAQVIELTGMPPICSAVAVLHSDLPDLFGNMVRISRVDMCTTNLTIQPVLVVQHPSQEIEDFAIPMTFLPSHDQALEEYMYELGMGDGAFVKSTASALDLADQVRTAPSETNRPTMESEPKHIEFINQFPHTDFVKRLALTPNETTVASVLTFIEPALAFSIVESRETQDESVPLFISGTSYAKTGDRQVVGEAFKDGTAKIAVGLGEVGIGYSHLIPIESMLPLGDHSIASCVELVIKNSDAKELKRKSMPKLNLPEGQSLEDFKESLLAQIKDL